MSIKCACCGNSMKEENAVCSVCGMSVILEMNNDPDFMEMLAREYAVSVLGATDIDVLCYQYTDENDNLLDEPVKQYIPLCNAGEYKPGSRIYISEEFEDLPSDRKIKVDLRIRKNGSSTPVNVDIFPGKVISHKKLGIEFREQLRACLVVGEGENVSYSGDFKLQ